MPVFLVRAECDMALERATCERCVSFLVDVKRCASAQTWSAVFVQKNLEQL